MSTKRESCAPKKFLRPPPASVTNKELNEAFKKTTNTVQKWVDAMKRGLYVDPTRCINVSYAYTFIRQLRVVIARLTAKLDDLNQEVKALQKVRTDIGLALERLTTAIKKGKDTVIFRPCFIRNRERDRARHLSYRTRDHVKMTPAQMVTAKQIMQTEFRRIVAQILHIGKIRGDIECELNERTRSLSYMPEVRSRIHQRHVACDDDARIDEFNQKQSKIELRIPPREPNSVKVYRTDGKPLQPTLKPIRDPPRLRRPSDFNQEEVFQDLSDSCKNMLLDVDKEIITSKELRQRIGLVTEEAFVVECVKKSTAKVQWPPEVMDGERYGNGTRAGCPQRRVFEWMEPYSRKLKGLTVT